jgi:hypothetical protein
MFEYHPSIKLADIISENGRRNQKTQLYVDNRFYVEKPKKTNSEVDVEIPTNDIKVLLRTSTYCLIRDTSMQNRGIF